MHFPKFLPAVLFALAVTSGHAATPPDADQILRQMSARLAAAREFSFKAHRQTHGEVLPGRALPEDAKIAVTVRRPNAIAAKSVSKDDVRDFYFDGQNLTLRDVSKNLYATVPMRTSIDGLLAGIEEKYGFTPPLGELAVSNPYEDIRQKVQGIAHVGRGKTTGGFLGLGGVECDRIQLKGQMVDAELWVGVADQLPHKLVVTYKNRAGQPRLTADLSDWNLASHAGDGAFAYAPTKGAVKIPMKTTAEMQAEMKKAGKKQ